MWYLPQKINQTVLEGSNLPAFYCCDLDINPMALKIKGDLDDLK